MKRKIVKVITLTIIICFSASVNATPVNWNAIEVNDVEYYVQTDKSTYLLGEDVEMLYKVTNLGEGDVTFSFPHSPEWNFWVEKNEENIWRAVNAWWLMITEFTLGSGESREFPFINTPYIWDMQDNESSLVSAGEYSVIGGLYAGTGYYDYTKVGVSIEIIPEPATILLLATGIILARAGKHKTSCQYKHG